MGKRFKYFTENNPKIQITAIIDNYINDSYLERNDKKIPVLFPEEFGKSGQIDEDTVLVIASVSINEIVEQLDRIKSFDNVLCCAEVALDDYIGLNDIKREQLKETIIELADRTEKSVLRDNYGESNLTAEIKKFQIWESFGMTNTAGTKALMDIRQIIGSMGYQIFNVHGVRGEKGSRIEECNYRLILSEWEYLFEILSEKAIIFIQFPSPIEIRFPREIILRMKREKHVRFICLVHDVNCLRNKERTQMRKEENRLIMEICDYFIIHNTSMQRYFESEGIPREKLIVLKIFDYMCEETNVAKVFEKSVTFAGNLSIEKSPFLEELEKLSPLKIHLYGPDCPECILNNNINNVKYEGIVPAELLPHNLDRGFGLIWDGNCISTCSGQTGEYLKYNNPHKMSLYLSAGLPVIIWSGAAQAKFAEENSVGFTVDSLLEINGILEKMDKAEYDILAQNAEKVARLLKDGYYTRTAVEKIETLLEKENMDDTKL